MEPARWMSLALALLPLLVAGKSDLSNAGFLCLPTGTRGSLEEDNLSSFMLAAASQPEDFVALDAGNLYNGLRVADQQGMLAKFVSPTKPRNSTNVAHFLKNQIKSYLVSGPRLDAVAGLVLSSSQISGGKPIMGSKFTIDNLRDHVFNYVVAPNVANEGGGAQSRFSYSRLEPRKVTPIPHTNLTVEMFPLCHAGCNKSSAFLVGNGRYLVLYMGATGPDALEGQNRLLELWKVVAPLISSKKLLAIFLETSHSNSRANNRLGGHMNPRWVLTELEALAKEVVKLNEWMAFNDALTGVNIIVTQLRTELEPESVEPASSVSGQTTQQGSTANGNANGNAGERIRQELVAGNHVNAHFIFPVQGVPLWITPDGVLTKTVVKPAEVVCPPQVVYKQVVREDEDKEGLEEEAARQEAEASEREQQVQAERASLSTSEGPAKHDHERHGEPKQKWQSRQARVLRKEAKWRRNHAAGGTEAEEVSQEERD